MNFNQTNLGIHHMWNSIFHQKWTLKSSKNAIEVGKCAFAHWPEVFFAAADVEHLKSLVSESMGISGS